MAFLVSVAVIVGGFIAYTVGSEVYCNLFHDASDHDERIVSGFYSCEENEKVVPGDAICYCEYYYDADIVDEIGENYILIEENNLDVVKKYMNRFQAMFLYDSDEGNKDFIENLSEGDYYYIKSGCSGELSENHFRLYYYDKESYTIYYMFRCQ